MSSWGMEDGVEADVPNRKDRKRSIDLSAWTRTEAIARSPRDVVCREEIGYNS